MGRVEGQPWQPQEIQQLLAVQCNKQRLFQDLEYPAIALCHSL
jgi:hypothetical protein